VIIFRQIIELNQ